MKKSQVKINDKVYELVSDYREDKDLREKFFTLANKGFGINLRKWYEEGCWGDGYRPYSLLDKGEMVANVSVSIADFTLKGQERHWIQLGCVIVEEVYRKAGLARFLIDYIMDQYEKISDGIFLFGNNRVIDFYPKFGFYQTNEYQYSKKVSCERNMIKSRLGQQKSQEALKKGEQLERNYYYRKLDPANKEDIRLVAHKTRQHYRGQLLAALHNTSLVMFYWQGPLSDDLYYIEALDTVVAFREEQDILQIEEVFGEAELNEIIAALVKDNIQRVDLGFVPVAKSEYGVNRFQEEDTVLFVSRKEMKELFETEKLMFPVLSHT